MRCRTFFLHMDNPRSEFLRDQHRVIPAAIVGHEDLAAHATALNAHPGLFDAPGERLCLVQARHHNG
jgi:hypothetical protein